jgi:hypothetical protein
MPTHEEMTADHREAVEDFLEEPSRWVIERRPCSQPTAALTAAWQACYGRSE